MSKDEMIEDDEHEILCASWKEKCFLQVHLVVINLWLCDFLGLHSLLNEALDQRLLKEATLSHDIEG